MDWVRGRFFWIRCGREDRGQIFVVRRNLGNAVKRNRLKRHLRSICRSRPYFPRNLVVFCQPSAVKAPFTDLERELDLLVAKIPIFLVPR